MVLNPTDNVLLEGHVENMLRYVEDERYKASWINRASTGFVLQMGSFYSHTVRPPLTIDSTRSVATFDPVLGFPASLTGLSNTVGTVAMALPSGAGGPLQDAGTSSFFVNLGSNTSLDADFTVFAAIPDMTVINQIMALMQIDRTTDPLFGASPGSLAFNDVPVTADGRQVFIQRAFVVEDAMTIAAAMSAVAPLMANSAAAGNGPGGSAVNGISIVPEPGAGVLCVAGLISALLAAHRRARNAAAHSS
jgi:cyclophilin family peptidyl-prolyl cis-trans isomerase